MHGSCSGRSSGSSSQKKKKRNSSGGWESFPSSDLLLSVTSAVAGSKVKLHQLTTATNITPPPPTLFLLSVFSSSGSCKFHIYNWPIKCSVTWHPQSLHARDAPIRNSESRSHIMGSRISWHPSGSSTDTSECSRLWLLTTWFQFYFDCVLLLLILRLCDIAS